MGLFEKLFGTRSQRELKKIQPIVDKILALETEYKNLSEEALRGKTQEFKNRLAEGETLDQLLPEAFPPSGRPPTVSSVCAPTPFSSSAVSSCIRAASPK